MMENWKEFKERLFGNDYMIWHDGPNINEFLLAQEDPQHVRQMVLDGLEAEDFVAVEALKSINIPELIPDLREKLKKVRGKFKVDLAVYLQEKDTPPDNRYALIVIDEILHPTWIIYMDAAISLRYFPLDYVRDVIFKIIAEHPDYYMRYHAAQSYLKLIGAKPNDIFEYKEIFPLICNKNESVTEEDYERFKKAAEMLKALE
jgi:hypothetical protein